MRGMSRLLAAAMGTALAAHARDGKHSGARRTKPASPAKRVREARRRDRKVTRRRIQHQEKRLDELRKLVRQGRLKPVHPRDHHWFAVGLSGGRFTLDAPSGRGASYWARYRAMYEAGVKAREERLAA